VGQAENEGKIATVPFGDSMMSSPEKQRPPRSRYV
jgi:hypothetical protein